MDLQTLPIPVSLGVGMIGVTLWLNRLHDDVNSSYGSSLEDLYATIQTFALSPILAVLLQDYRKSSRDAVEYMSLPETQQWVRNIRWYFDRYYELVSDSDRMLDSLTTSYRTSLLGGIVLIAIGLVSPFMGGFWPCAIIVVSFVIIAVITAWHFVAFRNQQRRVSYKKTRLHNLVSKVV